MGKYEVSVWGGSMYGGYYAECWVVSDRFSDYGEFQGFHFDTYRELLDWARQHFIKLDKNKRRDN